MVQWQDSVAPVAFRRNMLHSEAGEAHAALVCPHYTYQGNVLNKLNPFVRKITPVSKHYFLKEPFVRG